MLIQRYGTCLCGIIYVDPGWHSYIAVYLEEGTLMPSQVLIVAPAIRYGVARDFLDTSVYCASTNTGVVVYSRGDV